jgi:hypothetical protein
VQATKDIISKTQTGTLQECVFQATGIVKVCNNVIKLWEYLSNTLTSDEKEKMILDTAGAHLMRGLKEFVEMNKQANSMKMEMEQYSDKLRLSCFEICRLTRTFIQSVRKI